jgi:hypothetical protein
VTAARAAGSVEAYRSVPFFLLLLLCEQESASSVRAVVESAKYQASIEQLRDKFCKYTDELVAALASLPTTTYDSHMSLLAERLRFDGRPQ